MGRHSLLIGVIALGLWLGFGSARATDLFGKPDGGAPVAAASVRPAPTHEWLLPAPLRAAFTEIVAWQRWLNRALQDELDQAKLGRSWRAAAAIVLASFLYGVLHALGPGHGKVVIGGYVLARRARLLHGVAMSAAAAFVQALAAILLVGGLVVILDIGARQMLDRAASLEMVSYALIAVLGLVMAWIGVTRRDACCGHAHLPGHDHDHDHDHDHGGSGGILRGFGPWGQALATGAALGLRPCSGGLLVLLFAAANAILPVGVLAVFAMALGVAITVSLVSLTSFGFGRLAPSLAGRLDVATRSRLGRAVTLAGALLLLVIGSVQVLGLWYGVLTPSLG